MDTMKLERMKPEQVKKIRKQLGLSQEKLAQALGVSRLAVIRWENGQRYASGLAVRFLKHLSKCSQSRGSVRGNGV